MSRLLIDAGPLIAIFHQNDSKHAYCVERFQFLIASQYRLFITFPVLCEVHKLVQPYTHAAIAQNVLFELWESMDVLNLDDDLVQDAIALVTATPNWKGTLQDTSVIVLARKLDIEIWTLDSRDFSRYDDLRLWSKGGG